MLPSILALWSRAGHEVRLHQGTDALPEADLGVMHVDRSVIPAPYLEAMRRFPRTVNAATDDIRKRAVSTLLVRRGDGYAGQVIVKSDLNSGGRPEFVKWKGAQRLGRDAGPRPGYFPGDYPVYASPDAVPERFWSNPHMVVEKFVPEPGPEGWCLRCYWFLGGAEYNLVLHSRDTYIKGATTVRVEEGPAPAALRERRRELGFDYGKFDYVMRGGEPVLLDVNRTPASTLMTKFSLLEACAARLAPGLDALLA